MNKQKPNLTETFFTYETNQSQNPLRGTRRFENTRRNHARAHGNILNRKLTKHFEKSSEAKERRSQALLPLNVCLDINLSECQPDDSPHILLKTGAPFKLMFAICIRRALSRTRNGLCFSSSLLSRTVGSSSHIKQEPWSSRIGTTKLLLVMGPCIYFGGRLGRNLAELLDEWSIFCPEDDEEED